LIDFSNKVNKVGNPKAVATLTKQSMDYFKNNPARGLGEADLDEKAKWRSSSAAKKITDPDKDLGMADYDYHHENPRSTGRLKSTADTEPSDGSINNRAKSSINSKGDRKGKISKADINRVKSNAFNTLNKEEVEKQLSMDPDDKMWKVSYDHGPHQSNTIKVKAKSQSHAWEVAKEVAKEKYGHNRITSGSIESMKEEVEELDEAKAKPGHNARVMANNLNKVFKAKPDFLDMDKDGDKKEPMKKAAADSKKKVSEAPLLGPQGKIHRAASADQSDREYASQKSFKDAWTAKNVGKKWPGYSEAGYKHPAYKKEESALDEAVTLDYSRYMRAHGKKPRDAGMGSSTWMFTTAEFGDPGEDEIFQFQGSFADAKKAAAKWAKSQSEYRFYVME
jgi:hypothetical protein